MVKFTAVIFDLDGVICSTDRYHYLAWKNLTDNLGIPFDETINDSLRGVSRLESLEIILENCQGSNFSQSQKEELANHKNLYYQHLLQQLNHDDLSPEVETTLQQLKKMNYRLAVASSSKNARLILQRIGLQDFFACVVDGNQISRSKPDPEVFLKAASQIGIATSHCLVIEDALAGVKAARAGGFKVAGIGPAALLDVVDYSLQSFREILDIVGDN